MADQKRDIIDQILKLSVAERMELANVLGLAPTPTTVGMTPEQFQAILATTGSVNATAMQRALRKENPYYPERSVFNPQGLFDDHGHDLPPKVSFTRDTYHCGVLVGRAHSSEGLNTPEEIELFNRFSADKESRGGEWKAEIVKRGSVETLYVTHPHRSVDERMSLPPLTHILLELLEGEDAINPAKLVDQVAALKKRLAQLEAAQSQSVVVA